MELTEYIQNIILDLSIRTIKLPDIFHKEDPYLLACAQRLLYSFQEVIEQKVPVADFYVALRAWLGVKPTPLKLPELLRQTDMIQRFNLIELKDYKYTISNRYPEFIQNNFTNRVFYHKENTDIPEKRYSLRTSPYIYQLTGYKYYKSTSQQLAVDGAMQLPEGYTSLICMPTGAGKSLVTQSLAFHYKKSLTVVIVPTVSLAIDQERTAKKVNKNNTEGEIFSYHGSINLGPMLEAIKSQKAKLLFISPEAIQMNETIKNILFDAARLKYFQNLVIDEAHMVVEWGSSFRLDYQTLESFRNKIIKINAALRTILLSATYDSKEISILKLLFSDDNNKWVEIRCDAMRKEPLFHYISAKNESEKISITTKLVDLLPHPLILYVRRPEEAEQVKNLLHEYGYCGLRTFTGETRSKDREQIINDWSANKFSTMIATSAFGIGVDKKDVRTVLHLHVPENPNIYYQEVGRGGRDGYPSLGIMCVSSQDIQDAKGYAKRVLSEGKLIERWFAMLQNAIPYGQKNELRIDTSVLPKYSMTGNVVTGSQRHINWNVYVLLLLRRYNLINITDITLKENIVDDYKNVYLIFIQVIEPQLLKRSTSSENLLRKIRSSEAQYYGENFKAIDIAIKEVGNSCWSEMFYSVYNYVDEYCPGCDFHASVQGSRIASRSLPLRKCVRNVYRYSDQKLLPLRGSANETYIEAAYHFKEIAICLMRLGCKGIIVEENSEDEKHFLDSLQKDFSLRNLHFSIYNAQEFVDLQEGENWYFLNGPYLVLHTGNWQRNCAVVMAAKTINISEFWAIHLVHSNYNAGNSGRTIIELIEGSHFDEDSLKGELGDV